MNRGSSTSNFKFWVGLAGFLPIAALILFSNVVADPTNVFRTKQYSQQVAELLLAGCNVILPADSDWNYIAKYYATELQQKKDVLILGSSRAMVLRSSLFPGKTVFNSAISASYLENVVAITGMYFKQGHIPEEIVIGLDPWFLDGRGPFRRWKKFKNEYIDALDRFGIHDQRRWWLPFRMELPESAIAAFSLSYFQQSFKILLSSSRQTRASVTVTDQDEGPVRIRRADGSISYPDEAKRVSTAEVERLAHRYANAGAVDYFDGYTQMDENLMNILRQFVEAMHERRVRVVFFLSPFHPYVYSTFVNSERYAILDRIEQFYRRLAQQEDVPLIGSYNPTLYGCGPDEFYDGIHAKESCVDRIFDHDRGNRTLFQ